MNSVHIIGKSFIGKFFKRIFEYQWIYYNFQIGNEEQYKHTFTLQVDVIGLLFGRKFLLAKGYFISEGPQNFFVNLNIFGVEFYISSAIIQYNPVKISLANNFFYAHNWRTFLLGRPLVYFVKKTVRKRD